jgi:hypothetical protein
MYYNSKKEDDFRFKDKRHIMSVKKNRMMGDYQVRFCERLGVKLPLPTLRTDDNNDLFPSLGNHLRGLFYK